MAKKNNSEEVKNGKGRSGSFLTDERFKVTMGITVSGFAVLLFISFVSYLFTWKTDQSFAWSRVFSEPEYQVDNWSGKLGAYFSNLFINSWFGIASFAVPFMLLLIGFALMRVKIKNLSLILRTVIVGLILVSIWLGFVLGNLNGVLGSGLGGKHGLYLSEWLSAFAGTFGAALILIAATLIWMVFSNRNTLGWLGRLLSMNITLPSWLAKTEKDMASQPQAKTDGMPDGLNDLVFETEFNRHEREGKAVVVNNSETAEEEIELLVETPEDIDKPEDLPASYEMLEDYDPTLDLSHYQMPSVELLEKHDAENSTVTNEELISNKNKIVETLSNYKIQIDKIKATIGPTVTLYEIVPAPGVRISKIKSLEDDIALSLGSTRYSYHCTHAGERYHWH